MCASPHASCDLTKSCTAANRCQERVRLRKATEACGQLVSKAQKHLEADEGAIILVYSCYSLGRVWLQTVFLHLGEMESEQHFFQGFCVRIHSASIRWRSLQLFARALALVAPSQEQLVRCIGGSSLDRNRLQPRSRSRRVGMILQTVYF